MRHIGVAFTEQVGRVPRIVCESAGDISKLCQSLLLKHDIASRPRCVFGDILSRCPAPLLTKLQKCHSKMVARMEKQAEKGMPRSQAVEEQGRNFITEASCLLSEACCKLLPDLEETALLETHRREFVHRSNPNVSSELCGVGVSSRNNGQACASAVFSRNVVQPAWSCMSGQRREKPITCVVLGSATKKPRACDSSCACFSQTQELLCSTHSN